MKRAALLMLLALPLSACATNPDLAIQAPVLTVENARLKVPFCSVAQFMDPNKKDPLSTRKQKVSHNAVGKYLCSWNGSDEIPLVSE